MTETNKVNWVGIRPIQPLQNIQVHPGPFETSVAGTTRTQILKTGFSAAGTAIIHTVTAGKTLYITSCMANHTHSAASQGKIQIRDDSDVETALLIVLELAAAGVNFVAIGFPMPIVVPSEYDIVGITNFGILNTTIQGWEE